MRGKGDVGSRVDIFDRIREIRTHRRLPQREIAELLDISISSWNQKEKGKEGGFGPAEIAKFLEKTKIDARWLFGQLDCPIADAELDRRGPERTMWEEMKEELADLKRRNPKQKPDALTERCLSDVELREVVEKMIKYRAHLGEIKGYIDRLGEQIDDVQRRAHG